jgi:hypothetical protein
VPEIRQANKMTAVWFSVATPEQNSNAWNGGVVIQCTNTITTTSNPSRRFQRTGQLTGRHL